MTQCNRTARFNYTQPGPGRAANVLYLAATIIIQFQHSLGTGKVYRVRVTQDMERCHQLTLLEHNRHDVAVCSILPACSANFE